MNRHLRPVASTLLLGALLVAVPRTASGEEIPPEYRDTVNKGLSWLAKTQHKDGHWEGVNGQYAISMTALGGVALFEGTG